MPNGFFDVARVNEVLAELQERTKIVPTAVLPSVGPSGVIPGVSGAAGIGGQAGALRLAPAASAGTSMAPAAEEAAAVPALPSRRRPRLLRVENDFQFPPLQTWLEEAIAQARGAEDRPRRESGWRPPPFQLRLFELRRHAKGHPDLATASAVDAWVAVRATVPDILRRLGVEAGADSDFNGAGLRDADEALELWLGGWDDIVSPVGWDRITQCLRYACAAPLEVHSLFPRAGGTLKLLVAAAAWLQSSRGLEPICLPRDAWARALGVTQPRVSAMVRLMVQADLLRALDPRSIPQPGRALEYRFDCERFPVTVRHLALGERAEMQSAFEALAGWQATPSSAAMERARLPDLDSIRGTASQSKVVPLRRRET